MNYLWIIQLFNKSFIMNRLALTAVAADAAIKKTAAS